MKTIKIILTTITVCFLIISCVDLDETLRSNISAEVHYSTVTGIGDLKTAMYEPLRWYYPNEGGTHLNVVGTDEFTWGFGGREFWNDYSSGLNPTITDPRSMLGLWNNFYRGINYTNALINRVEKVDEISGSQKNSLIAEARFLRAHYYYVLVQHFGPVHLTLQETIGVETEANRTPENEIWPVIIDDLDFAINNLPETAQYGMATKDAARHNLAKVYLILENWDDAYSLASDVVNSGNHSLLENYEDLWDPYNQEHTEVIFGVATPIGNNILPNYAITRSFNARVDRRIQGMTRDPRFGTGNARNKPTRYLIEEIFGNDPNNGGVNIWNDSRFNASFKEAWFYNNPVTLPAGAAIGDTSAYFPVATFYQDLTDEEIADKSYVFFRMDDWTADMYLGMVRKWRTPIESLDGQSGKNFQVFRLADTYLIAAEALMMLGELQRASDYFNVVRKRAEVPGQSIPLIQPSELNIDEILNERSRELAGEFHRWKDLKRTGQLLDRVRAYNDRAAPNIQEFHLRRPIPQSQIDRTTNGYEQNPGY